MQKKKILLTGYKMGKKLLDDCTQRIMGCYLEPVTSGITQESVLSCLTYLLVAWAQNWGYQLPCSKAGLRFRPRQARGTGK